MWTRLITTRIGSDSYSYRVIIECDEDGRFVAECPVLEGCYSEGSSFNNALEMIKDAIKINIDSRLGVGESIPEVEYVSRNYKPKSMRIGNRKNRFDYLIA